MPEITREMLLKMSHIAGNTPKINKLVLFLGRSGGQLIDNAKHCYLESIRGNYNFKSILYTECRQAASELMTNKVSFINELDFTLLSRVAVVVCDDFHWRGGIIDHMTHGAKIIQLWHGIPLKSIGMVQALTEHQNMSQERQSWIRFGYSGYEAVLSTSDYVAKNIFNQVFETKKFLNFGYPRNDVLLRPTVKLDKLDMINVPRKLLSRLQQHRKSGGKVIAYMPTFRDYNAKGELTGSQNAGRYLDISALDRFGQQNNVLFMLKYHPYVKDIPDNLPEHCIFCPHWADAYPLLRFTDILLTDYSSVYFDYLLLNRPIHYFVPDKEEYEQKDRKFMLNFDDWTPGTKSRSQEDCFAHLKQIIANNMDDGMETARIKIRDILFKHHDDQAAARCCRFLEECSSTAGVSLRQEETHETPFG